FTTTLNCFGSKTASWTLNIFYRDTSGGVQHVSFDPSGCIVKPPKLVAEPWGFGAGTDTNGPNALGGPAVVPSGGLKGFSYTHIFYRAQAGNLQNVLRNLGGLHAQVWAGGNVNTYLPPIQYSANLPPSQTGSRLWNYNFDGVAHYGMLPDFLQS